MDYFHPLFPRIRADGNSIKIFIQSHSEISLFQQGQGSIEEEEEEGLADSLVLGDFNSLLAVRIRRLPTCDD